MGTNSGNLHGLSAKTYEIYSYKHNGLISRPPHDSDHNTQPSYLQNLPISSLGSLDYEEIGQYASLNRIAGPAPMPPVSTDLAPARIVLDALQIIIHPEPRSSFIHSASLMNLHTRREVHAQLEPQARPSTPNPSIFLQATSASVCTEDMERFQLSPSNEPLETPSLQLSDMDVSQRGACGGAAAAASPHSHHHQHSNSPSELQPRNEAASALDRKPTAAARAARTSVVAIARNAGDGTDAMAYERSNSYIVDDSRPNYVENPTYYREQAFESDEAYKHNEPAQRPFRPGMSRSLGDFKAPFDHSRLHCFLEKCIFHRINK